MIKYDVYQHPVRGYAGAKIGFSWPGLFFGIFWALAKRLWKVAGMLISIIIVSEIFFPLFTNFGRGVNHFLLSNFIIAFGLLVELLAPVIIWIIVGFKGNEWVKADLLNRGYRLLRTVESTSPDAAIASVFEKNE